MLKLTLDASGVNALFPEGTEARLQLSQAVVAEIVKKTVPKYIDETVNIAIKSAFNGKTGEHLSAINDGVNKGIETYIQNRYSGINLLDRAKAEINDEVKQLASNEIERLISKGVRSQFSEEMDSLKERIDAEIEKKLATLTDNNLAEYIEKKAKLLIERAAKA